MLTNAFTLDFPKDRSYKLYDIDSKQIFISRDVKFYEHVFPYNKEDTSNDNTISLPLPITNDFIADKELNSFRTPKDTQTEAIQEAEDEPNEVPNVNEINRCDKCSTRQRNPPSWMDDFVVNASITNELPLATNPYTHLP